MKNKHLFKILYINYNINHIKLNKQMASEQKIPYIHVKDFDINKFKVVPLTTENVKKTTDTMKMTFASYQNMFGPPAFKTDIIVLTEGGIIPFINPKTNQQFSFYKDENDPSRHSINIPLDLSQSGGRQLHFMMSEIDDYMVKNKSTIIAHKPFKGFGYSPAIKKPTITEGEEKNYNTLPKIKVKFGKNYNTKQFTTKVYKKEQSSNKFSEIKVNSFKDIENVIHRNAKFKMLISIRKVWFSSALKTYGISCNCDQLVVFDSGVSNSITQRFAFAEDGECDSETELDSKSKDINETSEHEDDTSDDNVIKEQKKIKVVSKIKKNVKNKQATEPIDEPQELLNSDDDNISDDEPEHIIKEKPKNVIKKVIKNKQTSAKPIDEPEGSSSNEDSTD